MRASPNRRILYTAGAMLAAESALFIGLTVRAHEHGIDLSQAKWPTILAVWFGPAAVLTALAWFIERLLR